MTCESLRDLEVIAVLFVASYQWIIILDAVDERARFARASIECRNCIELPQS